MNKAVDTKGHHQNNKLESNSIYIWSALIVSVLILAALGSLIPRKSLINQFRLSEQSEIERNALLFNNIMQSELESLNNMCADWANWDDTYQFMLDSNDEYLKTNMEWEPLKEKSKIDLIYFVDLAGNTIWGGQSNTLPEDGESSLISAADPEMVQFIKNISQSDFNGTGILLHGKFGPILISSNSIYPSSGYGNSRGMLIMGRNLDDQLVEKMSQQVQMDIDIRYPGQGNFSPAEQHLVESLGQKPYVIDRLDGQESRVYSLLKDLQGQPVLASFKWSGDVMAQGVRAANYAYGSFAIAILMVTAILIMGFTLYARQVRRKRKEIEQELEVRARELTNSEERYRQVLDHAQDAIVLYDRNFKILNTNQNAHARLGYTAQEAASLAPFHLIAPEWREFEKKQVDALKANMSTQYESVHLNKDGSLVPVEVSSVLTNFNGQQVVLSIVRDISARKRAEEALRESERLYRMIFENSPAGIVYVTQDGRIVNANARFAKMFKMNLENLIGTGFFEKLACERFTEMGRRAFAGETVMFEYKYFPSPEEPPLYLRIMLSPLDIDQKPSELICLIEDITIHKRDEEKLRQLYTAIEQSPVSVIITNGQGKIQYVNHTFVQTSGYSLEEAIGVNAFSNEATEIPTDVINDARTTILDGRIWKGEFHSIKKSGEWFWERVAVAPVLDEQWRITNFVIFKEEITKNKLIEQANSVIHILENAPYSYEGLMQQSLDEALRLSGSVLGFVCVQEEHQFFERGTFISPPDLPCSATAQQMASIIKIWECCEKEGSPLIINDFSEGKNADLPEDHIPLQRIMALSLCESDGKAVALLIVANKNSDYTRMDAGIVAYFADMVWSTIRRKETEKALWEVQERSQTIFEAVQTAIILIECDTKKIIDANPAALNMYQGCLEDLQGQSCFDTICAADCDRCPVLDLEQTIDGSEKVMRRRDGNTTPILKTVTRLSLGNKSYLLESFVDLSERKIIEEQLRLAKEAAEAAFQAKGQFLANMSHEIRTPMNAVLGYVQLMQRDPSLSIEQQKNLEIIGSSGNYLLTIINDILEMAKIEAGLAAVNETVCDLRHLLDDIQNMFRIPCKEKGLSLAFVQSECLPQTIIVDQGKVQQVLINLLGNAVKFTDQGGISVRVLLGEPVLEGGKDYNDDKVCIFIDVEDSGSGIIPQDTDRVFGFFEQAEGSFKVGGAGLGLAISREFSRMLGGSLRLIRSQVNEGSLFRFTFMARRSDCEWINNRTETVRRVKDISGNDLEWRILVVDDRQTNRTLLEKLLTARGFAVRLAENGRAAIQIFEEWQPRIILMDLMMPEMDGYEAIRKLKDSVGGKNTPIIAISASVMEENVARAYESGADAFVRKPLQEDELLQVIQQVSGVEYNYEDNHNGEEDLQSEQLQLFGIISPEDIKTMRTAVESGDMQELQDLLEGLTHQDHVTANKLRGFADKYDYEGLIKLLGQMLQNNKDKSI